jgi:hypothetical protein
MGHSELRQTLQSIVDLSNQKFDRYRLPMRVPVEGIGKFHILEHQVVLRTNSGVIKTITSQNVAQHAAELARI